MKTKFVPPVARSRMIRRRRLLESNLPDRPPKLTLVAAPAGFGKTTVLTQWREHLLHRGIAVPWLSLHADDDGGATALLRDVVESIQAAMPDFGARSGRVVRGTAPIDLTRTLKGLVDDLMDVAQPLMLFVDDYHNVTGPETDELVELLLNLAPPNFQMTVASRTRPQFGLAALRVRDELRELTPAQLRFSLAEATEFLTELRRLELSPRQVERIHEHSEGWVAGLQLASLALRDPHRRDGFIESFSGRLQDIADYMASDVLNQQPEDVQEFLLRTSVADRMTGDLARHLTGADDAQRLLEDIERDGLFVTPLDQEHLWYRYHQLFQEFLLTELRRRHPGEVVGLYRKAAEWFEAEGLAGEAIEYALLAGDLEKAVTLVERQSWIELMAGRMPRVIAWMHRIPEPVRDGNPRLLYLLGTALYHTNRADESESVLATLTALVGERRDALEAGEAARLDERIRVLAAGIAMARDDPNRILALLERDFLHLNEFERGLVCNFRGYAHADLTQFAEATKNLRAARQHHLAAGSEFGAIYSECFLALTDFANGNLDHCYARFAPGRAGRSASEGKYVAPVPQVIEGIVLYQWNRIDEALERLQPNLPLIGEVGFTKLLVFGYMALARISALRGDHRAAMRCYDLISAAGARKGTPYERHRSLVEGGRIAYLLQSGRLNEAIDYALSADIDVDAETWALPPQWERVSCRMALTWARLQIATGRAENTLPVLARLRELATEARRGMRVLECYILEARARFDRDKAAARSLIDEALDVAAPNHSVRCFVDEGPEIDHLLLDSRRGDVESWPSSKRSFLDELTVFINASAAPGGEACARGGGAQGLIEPMSEREREILGLIAAGNTNSVISETLYISRNTVKWHLKNIFGKLGVNNRTSAVAVARQLELLP